jgi:hypothetical protein
MTIYTVCWTDSDNQKHHVLIEAESKMDARLQVAERSEYIAQHPNCIKYILEGNIR